MPHTHPPTAHLLLLLLVSKSLTGRDHHTKRSPDPGLLEEGCCVRYSALNPRCAQQSLSQHAPVSVQACRAPGSCAGRASSASCFVCTVVVLFGTSTCLQAVCPGTTIVLALSRSYPPVWRLARFDCPSLRCCPTCPTLPPPTLDSLCDVQERRLNLCATAPTGTAHEQRTKGTVPVNPALKTAKQTTRLFI